MLQDQPRRATRIQICLNSVGFVHVGGVPEPGQIVMLRHLILAAATAGMATGGAIEADNPFASLPTTAATVARLSRSAEFGEPGADTALAQWLEGHPLASKEEKRIGWARLCKDYEVMTLYRRAATACAAAAANGGDSTSGIPAALIGAPPVQAKGSARVPLVWNALGSQDTNVEVNGVVLPWLVDTGAEISVVTRTNAQRMGVRLAKGDFEVSSTTAAVHGEVGMIARMHIGPATVRNVPVLVLPDAQLSIGGANAIQGILGLQVLRSFHRVAWLDNGATLALGQTAPEVTDRRYRLYWNDAGLGAPLATAVGVMGAHVDTGSNTTFLWAPGLALLTSSERSTTVKKSAKLGGAGGVVAVQEERFPSLTFDFAGLKAPLMNVSLSTSKGTGAARIGMDLIGACETLVFDFDHMTLRATPGDMSPKDHSTL